MTALTENTAESWPWGVPVPPSGDELPCDDGEPMETELHGKQMDLTLDYARHLLRGQNAYVAGNMAFYYSSLQARNLDFKAPDVMIMLGAKPRVRKSWVVWEEDGLCPSVVIELVSESTAAHDYGRKKNVYEMLRVPEYFVFDPLTSTLDGWRLVGGRYEALIPDADERLPSVELGVRLGAVEGRWGEVDHRWLRFIDADGQVVRTEGEAEAARANTETVRANADAVRANAEAVRANAEAVRANAEAERANAAERELAALKARLAALEGTGQPT